MSHALQGEINYIVEILEDHTYGDNVELVKKGIDVRLVYVQKSSEWIFMDYRTDKFINDCSLEDVLRQLPFGLIRQLHEVVLKEFAL